VKNYQSLKPDAQGRIKIPEQPGLGFEVDWNIVEKYGSRISVCTKLSVGIDAILQRGLKMALYLKGKKDKQVLEQHDEQQQRKQQKLFQVPQPPFIQQHEEITRIPTLPLFVPLHGANPQSFKTLVSDVISITLSKTGYFFWICLFLLIIIIFK
jgi:hypothetical protein